MILTPVYRWLRRHLLQRLIPSSKKPLPLELRHVQIVGYFTLIAGVGESARLCASALLDYGFEVSCIDVTSWSGKRPEYAWPGNSTSRPVDLSPTPHAEFARILHLNPPMLPPVIIRMGLRSYGLTFNIAYWAWELDTLPAEWIQAIRYVNAIFVPSTFTAKALMKYTTKPVVVVPHPVRPGPASKDIRSRLGLSANSFIVATIFSFGSSAERKNPQASVEAFRRAFSQVKEAYLVIKASHGVDHQTDLAQLVSYIGSTPNILLVDEIWSSEEISGLISDADVYISLHRSEGFGLTIAEALLRATPIVATNWSGNTDFCCPHSTSLIGYKLVAADTKDSVSAFHGGQWAEPDIDEAAHALQVIFEDNDRARKRAEHAKTYAENYFGGHTYRDGLRQLREVSSRLNVSR